MAASTKTFPDINCLEEAIKVSKTLLVPVSAEDISENKQFAKVLSDLCTIVTSEDNDFFIKNEQREAEEKLKQAKIFYLEQQIVYDALQDILLKNTVEISLHRSSVSSEEKVLSDLSEKIASTEVCNYLHSDGNDQLLGLSPEFVMKTAPAISEQGIKQVVIPKIEEAIFKKCKIILQFYGKGTNDKLVSSKIHQLPSLLQADLQSLEHEKQLLSKQKISRLITIQNYAQVLLGGIEMLQQLIMNHRLGARPNYYSVTADYLTNKAHALLLKLRLIELRLLCDTYTRDTVAALKVIRKNLREEEENVKKELTTASNTLEMYERVGPSFKGLISEYTQLLQDIENKKWALKTF